MTPFPTPNPAPHCPDLAINMEAFRDKARQLLEETGVERSSRSSEGFGSIESALPKDMGSTFSIPLIDKGKVVNALPISFFAESPWYWSLMTSSIILPWCQQPYRLPSRSFCRMRLAPGQYRLPPCTRLPARAAAMAGRVHCCLLPKEHGQGCQRCRCEYRR